MVLNSAGKKVAKVNSTVLNMHGHVGDGGSSSGDATATSIRPVLPFLLCFLIYFLIAFLFLSFFLIFIINTRIRHEYHGGCG